MLYYYVTLLTFGNYRTRFLALCAVSVTMGQSLSCLSCVSRNAKVMPLGTMPNAIKYPNSALLVPSFHRPMRSPLERLSNRSSLATISLGSVQTLSSTTGETTNKGTTTGDHQESSPSSKRHPGMFSK